MAIKSEKQAQDTATEIPPPPEVRQCTDPANPSYGAVAVKASLGSFAWAVMHPQQGGHWETDDAAVSSWTVLPAP